MRRRGLCRKTDGVFNTLFHKGENLILAACVLSWFGQDVWVIPNRKSLIAPDTKIAHFRLTPKQIMGDIETNFIGGLVSRCNCSGNALRYRKLATMRCRQQNFNFQNVI